MSVKLFGKSQILRKDEELQVLREGDIKSGQVVYIDGKPVKRNPLKFCIRANVQPMGSFDLLLVPEHDRFREQLWAYFENKAIVIDEGIEIESTSLLQVEDKVTRLGIAYQVQGVENWGSYSRARLMRIDVGPDASP